MNVCSHWLIQKILPVFQIIEYPFLKDSLGFCIFVVVVVVNLTNKSLETQRNKTT